MDAKYVHECIYNSLKTVYDTYRHHTHYQTPLSLKWLENLILQQQDHYI